MEVITVEASVFQQMVGMYDSIITRLDAQCEELKRLKSDYLMTPQEVLQYTGFGKRWLESHRDEITWTKPGGEYRFLKSDLDKFLATYKGGNGVKNIKKSR